MSTQTSDPGFGRGQTLGVTVKLYEAENGDGSTVIGTRKEFRDENPKTGQLYSNRPVECVAVKNVSGGALLPGTVVKFKAAATSGQFSGGILGEVDATATTTNATPAANGLVGVVDEYLPSSGVADKEVFWLVTRGPSTVVKSTTSVSAGAAYGTSATAGEAAAHTAGTTTLVGYALETSATATGRVLVRTTAGF
jgi:hypothetical protein